MDSVNKWFAIIANIGVIAGIAFLAIEISQNSDLMEAQARFNRLSISKEAFNLLSSNGELAEIMVKARDGEELTKVEEYRVTMAHRRYFANMEWIFRELPLDSPERKYAEINLIQSLGAEPLRRQVFEDNKSGFDPNFVIWMEENIIGY